MRVFLITHVDGGSSRPVEVAEGTTVADLLGHLGDRRPIKRLRIRINRRPARLTDVLHPGDRVSTTARGIAARCSADRLVAAGLAVHRPKWADRVRERPDIPDRGGDDDPVIKLLRERWTAIPHELQAEMHSDLQHVLDEQPFSIRGPE